MRLPTKCIVIWCCLLGVAIGGELRVATYNVRNYLEENRLADGIYRKAYPKPESEKDALRAVIRALKADVLALQEVGDERFMRELVRDLKSEGLDYPHIALTHVGGDVRGLAVLSKKPFANVEEAGDLKFKYMNGEDKVRRGLLTVRLEEGGEQLTLFVLHLKSKFTERKEDEGANLFRAKEAEAIRNYVLALFPDPQKARFMVLGDFNSTRDDRPVRSLLRKGKLEVSKWLPAEDGRGDSWTYFYRKGLSYSRVDHVLVSPGLFDAVQSSGICDIPEVMQASDHRPVFVILEFGK